MTWTTRATDEGTSTVIASVLDADDRALSCAEVLALLRDSAPFRAFFARDLAQSRYDAFFWETPPLTTSTLATTYEHAVIDAPALARITADPSDFAERFESKPSDDVLVFPNLGRDATLVVPAPRAADASYAHLAAFVRGAPSAQVDALFAKLARAILARIGDAPLWVSTAGLGVSWLHLRLDARPKYYRRDAYRRARS
ncbi:DUF6940 family protein [Sandaracinus amylolyticus]|uniref:Uncharacterized protein n=1 Tax=Sandaracinus amylolyticus TaxID=927083 RepID=A0A0F6YHW8_9BACT|nr:hypothetical protein [Sandaracinus amylolyticus]AKF05213.1 hypothetical protein DB32_002362 [Sandaracinus amylolyticus]